MPGIWSLWRGSCSNKSREELFSDLVDILGLVLDKISDTLTFVRGEANSVINVTFSGGVEVANWFVIEDINLSDNVTSHSRSTLPLPAKVHRLPQAD